MGNNWREREREKFICHIIISQHKYKCNDKFKQRPAARKEVPSQLATYDNFKQYNDNNGIKIINKKTDGKCKNED